MRRFLTLLLAVLFITAIIAPVTLSAAATGAEYLRVGGDNVSLYANELVPVALFTLPKTYYVKVLKLSYTPEYHIAEYNGVRGLVKISDVGTNVVSDVENPYYTAQTITAHVNTYLYTSPNFSAATAIEANGLSLTYLGKVNGDKGTYDTAVWFAVLYANEVYYLHCSLTNNLGLLESTFAPVHPNSVLTEDEQGKEVAAVTEKTQEGGGVDIVRVLLIVGMIVPLLIVVFLLFKPKRRPAMQRRARRYPDEDDYDDDYE